MFYDTFFPATALHTDGNVGNWDWADFFLFLFCYVIDLVSEQEILPGHPSLQAAAELNLLTHCFQSVMQDLGCKY